MHIYLYKENFRIKKTTIPYSFPLEWSKIPYPINIGGGDPLEAWANVSTFCINPPTI
jgi:hypothetical protein